MPEIESISGISPIYLRLTTHQRVQHPMRNLVWIWFVGCGAWIIDASVSLSYRNWPHAGLAFAIAALFFAAGLLFRKNEAEPTARPYQAPEPSPHRSPLVI
jgi:hypothetical protein